MAGLVAPIPDESDATADQEIGKGQVQQQACGFGGEAEGVGHASEEAGQGVAAVEIEADPVNEVVDGDPGDPGEQADGAVREEADEAEQGRNQGEYPEEVTEGEARDGVVWQDEVRGAAEVDDEERGGHCEQEGGRCVSKEAREGHSGR